jgi:trehalose synthase
VDGLREVPVRPLEPGRLGLFIGSERVAELGAAGLRARSILSGARVVNLNSTAAGGGVAEMLHTLIAYARGAGVDARWLVLAADASFFAVTKRIHNLLYGSPGDGGELGTAERTRFEAVADRNAEWLESFLRPGDVFIAHDPQTAGLIETARRAGATTVWRCHVGRDEPNEWTERGWAFLRPYLETADAYVFSRAAFAPAWLDRTRLRVIHPSIDPFAAKNAEMPDSVVRAALAQIGLLGSTGSGGAEFARADGTHGRFLSKAGVVRAGPAPSPGAPLVVQVSRWDPWKDMAGVMRGFVEHVDPALGARLVLAGPAVEGVADDPEAAEVFAECAALWEALPDERRRSVDLAQLPMDDAEENAAIVNALQRHATCVVQKSLAEGFGLTVAEAMWKRKPVVASAVGGIVDQIADGDGCLLHDPGDLTAFGGAVERLLREPGVAAQIGRNAHARVTSMFLPDRHLEDYARLIEELVGA